MKERVIYTHEVPRGLTPRQRKKFVRKIRQAEAPKKVRFTKGS